MSKQDVIKQLELEHRALKQMVSSLTHEQITKERIFNDWTVKDIVIHISAWHRKGIEELDDLAAQREPWIVGADVDDFNRRVVQERKRWQWQEVLEDWMTSYDALIQSIQKIPDKQWNEETGVYWPDGRPLTRASLFTYTYEGANHEGGHGKQIREHFAV